MMDYYYNSCYAANSDFWNQAAIDKRFKIGDNSVNSSVYGDSINRNASKFSFNLIARQINMIVGRQRQNRKSTVALPRFQNDALSDDYNKVLKWSETLDGFQEYFSQAFEDACDTGISLLHLYPNYNTDPISGDLSSDRVAYNNFLIDPFFRKQDLSDCNFIWRRKWVTKDAAKSLLPQLSNEIDKINPSGMKDGKFPLQAELINADLSNMFTYDEFYYLSFRDCIIIQDPNSEESSEWFGTNEELKKILEIQPWLTKRIIKKPTVKLAISLSGKVYYNGENLLGIDRYPFIPVLAYHEPDVQSYAWRIRGVIRNIRDAQYLYNRRKGIELNILESQINSGWVFPAEALCDPKSLRQTGEGFLVALKEGRSVSEIQRIDPPGLPPSLLELSQSISNDISSISGVNEELLGSATDDKSGILSMLRQGAGLTTLQTLFDKLDYSQRLYGQIRLEAIIKNFSRGKVRSILGKDPDDAFFSGVGLRFGIQVEEGNYSATQRQTELQQLLQFKEMGLEIPSSSIISAAIISNKKELLEKIQENEQITAQAQQKQVEEEAKLSESQANTSAVEAYAKSSLDLARKEEVQANTEYLHSKSTLDMIKGISELENSKFEKFSKAFAIAKNIRDETKKESEDERFEGINVTE